ncbi:MAG: nuclear transport factor 2 family protein [Nostocales cyanobacterium ELA583]|jgi:ketosteroid isomerase-like protein
MQKGIQFLLVLLLWLSINATNAYANQVTDLQNVKVINHAQIDFNVRKFVDAYLQIWNDQALDKVDNYYTPDIVYRDIALGTTNKGIQELKQFMRDQFQATPDLKFKTLDVVVESPKKIAVKWLMTGSENGNPFETEGVSIMELKQGKVFKNTDYYN